jgi:hypothetical protein
LYDEYVGSEKMSGVDRVYSPREIKQVVHEERLETGIPYVKVEIETLNRKLKW